MMTQVFTGPPTVTTHPTSQLMAVNMNITLNCEGTGEGVIEYQWETRDINGERWVIISDSNFKMLIVSNFKQSQQYRCVVFNEAGSTRSDVATITALGKLSASNYMTLCVYTYLQCTSIGLLLLRV